jgi:hypothetical protein
MRALEFWCEMMRTDKLTNEVGVMVGRVHAVIFLVDDKGREGPLAEAQELFLKFLDGFGIDVGFVVSVDQDITLFVKNVYGRNRHYSFLLKFV